MNEKKAVGVRVRWFRVLRLLSPVVAARLEDISSPAVALLLLLSQTRDTSSPVVTALWVSAAQTALRSSPLVRFDLRRYLFSGGGVAASSLSNEGYFFSGGDCVVGFGCTNGIEEFASSPIYMFFFSGNTNGGELCFSQSGLTVSLLSWWQFLFSTFVIGMASSSHTRSYPLRLYEEGKSPLQKRSMAHSCYVSQIGKIKDGLGADVWDELKKTTLGLFIKPIRFSLYEFENITGLNCDMFDESDTGETDYKDFWNEMGVSTSVGPLFTELERVFEISKTWSLEKRMMVGRLCLLSVGVHGIHHGSRVPLSSAKRVLDPVAFEKYPWGRVAFDSLLRSVKIVKYDGDSYVIHGCVQTLLVWIYESVPGIGEACGFRKTNLTGVPLLDWRSSRKRFNFTAFIEKEKAAHGQVRVRHMIPVSEENMYPQWSDSAENHDTTLDNLLKDIIHNRLQSHAWTHVAARRKRKQNQESSNEDGESKVIESTPADDVSHKKQRTGKAHIKVDEEEKTSLLDIWNMLEKMNVTISDHFLVYP
ncbi:hypothetical protein AXX17_AT5G35660 [Arabidopsis thaliana]|uniref:DUF1985 domain-containing protein n=1 Tax=Arabidopsis thaliana TaxID=3702 RepID=A0A178UCK3_ARATH|nr:hypothetical protein AXX17_AT5G35660 [Arabidopsis thaliana]